VKAGTNAVFVVWVWSADAKTYGASVAASVASAKYVDAPSFKICPAAKGKTCKIGNLPTGQADELEAAAKVGPKATLGELVTLKVKASAKHSRAFSGSASDVVVVAPSVNPTPPALPTSLPTLPGTGTSPTNPAGLFPTVPPSSSSSPSTGAPLLPGAKHHQAVHVAAASATVPLDARLIGGQLAGLAVLAGAIAIAVVRLSLRRPRAQEGNAPPSPPQ
jgi:hypothetical protein